MTNYQPNSEAASLETQEFEESTTINAAEIVETVISSLDQEGSAMVNHQDGSSLWKFKYGSAEIFVQLTGLTDADTFTVWSAVLALPVKDEPKLMRQLLEMNWSQTFEAHFAIFGDHIVVISTRTVADLSPGEISRIITVVATIADDHDDALQAEFSAA